MIATVNILTKIPYFCLIREIQGKLILIIFRGAFAVVSRCLVKKLSSDLIHMSYVTIYLHSSGRIITRLILIKLGSHWVYSPVYYPVYSKPTRRLPMTTYIDIIESNVLFRVYDFFYVPILKKS